MKMNHRIEKQSARKKQKIKNRAGSEDEEEQCSLNFKRGASNSKSTSRQRQENSLGELTRNFINFIKCQGDKLININDVVRKLKVKKRRIYDITNVLEGIGYIRKQGKNKIEWTNKMDLCDEEDSESYKEESKIDESSIDTSNIISNLQYDITGLNSEESKLDKYINEIKASFERLNEDDSFKEYGYVTFEDIKALTIGEDINLIAIKAPPGTSVEIPDPEQIHKIYLQTYENMKSGKEEYDQSLLDSLGKKYQIFIDSPNGEINVYLVLSKSEESELNKPSPFNFNTRTSFNNVLQQNNSFRNIQKNFMDGDMI